MMLPFAVFKTAVTAEPETVHLNPLAVSTVLEQEHRSGYTGWTKVAVITLIHGGKFTVHVHDPDRSAAQSIAEAQAVLREEPTP